MMNVAGGWILAPVVLVLVIIGHGLLVERAARRRFDGGLLPAVGLAAVIVLGGLLTAFEATARLSAPAAAGATVAGFALNQRWRQRRAARASLGPLAVGSLAFVLFALPSLLTGQASIAGYVKLDDSATWLALADRVVDHGRNLDGLPPSSYRRTLEAWLGSGYPVGSLIPLGLTSRLTGVDAAAMYQAVIAVYAAVLATGLVACARAFAGGIWRAGFAAVLAVQASLFFGYAQLGGVKEVASAALLPPLAVLATAVWQPRGLTALGPLCLVAGAMLGLLGLNGLVWAAPALAVGFVGGVAALRRDPRMSGRVNVVLAGTAVLVVFLVASLPALLVVKFVEHTTSGALGRSDDLGNLVRPLPLLQAGGIWPVGDFRFDPERRGLVVWLAGICVLCTAVALAIAAHRRVGVLVALAGIAVAGAVPALAIGSPWVDAKALSILAPVVLLCAAALAGALLSEADVFTRVVGSTLALVLVAGCAWSTTAVVSDVYVAPRARLAELRAVAARVAGAGPLVLLDFDVYADRYFLRAADPEGATDLRVRPVARSDGTLFAERTTAEVDEVRLADLWMYRTIVRRRSPSSSRPPSAFRLTHAGRYWEAWQRPHDAAPPIARLPLGAGADPTGVPGCDDIRRLARTPGVRALIALPRPAPLVVPLDGTGAPSSWRTDRGLAADRDGVVSMTVVVQGRYRIWVGGSTLGRLEVLVDGQSAGALTHELAHAGQWLRFSSVAFRPGRHEIRLRYSRGLRAGTGFSPPPLGPLALSPARFDDDVQPIRLSPEAFRKLCDGRRYDWVEAVA